MPGETAAVSTDRYVSRLKHLTNAGRLSVMDRLGPPTAAGYPLSAVLDRTPLCDQDRLLLLLWPETVGPDRLLRFVEAIVGTGPCCKTCTGKETPRTRQTYIGAWFSIRCHLARHVGAEAPELARMIAWMRSAP